MSSEVGGVYVSVNDNVETPEVSPHLIILPLVTHPKQLPSVPKMQITHK